MLLFSDFRTESSKMRDRPSFAFAVCTFIVFICLCIRNVETLLAPALLNEDGRDLFGQYYNISLMAGLLRFYAGYLSITTNIVATVIALLPVEYQPQIYVFVSITISSMCISCFALPIFRDAIRSDKLRLVSCLLVALCPMSLGVIDTEVGYIQWPVSVVLFQLIAVNALSKGSSIQRTLILIIMSLFSFSIPSSVIVTPIVIADIFQERGKGKTCSYHVLFLIVLIMYAIFGRNSGAYEIKDTFLGDGSRSLVEHVISDAVFGSILRQWIQMKSPIILYAVVITLIVLAGRSASETVGEGSKRYIVCILYISVITMYLSAAIRGVPVERIWPRRFSYAQSIMVAQLFFSCWTLALIKLPLKRRVLLLVSVALFLIFTNTLSMKSYKASRAAGLEVRDLTVAVAHAEARGETRKFHLERGAWSIDLQSRAKTMSGF